MDLSDFAEERGWTEAFGENLLERNRFTEDGAEFGTGGLYGVAPQAEVVGWYYNKDKFEEAGVEAPRTFDELTEALAALQEADLTPVAFGNSEGWPAIHTYGAVQHTYTDTSTLDDFIFRREGGTFTEEGNVEAARIVQDWADQGYFTNNFEGIGYDDSWGQFAAGEGAMMLTGSWISGELDQQSYGFFLTPGRDGELPPQIGGQGVPLSVRAGTDVPELAAEYIDWMTGERAAELWIEQGILPARVPASDAVEEGTLLADIVAAWDTVLAENQLGHYLDWASPTMYDTITAQLQSLLTGRVEPEQFVESVETDYTAAQ
jgi:raffinose/stachyose/melibiose transport system substrate-binding protein